MYSRKTGRIRLFVRPERGTAMDAMQIVVNQVGVVGVCLVCGGLVVLGGASFLEQSRRGRRLRERAIPVEITPQPEPVPVPIMIEKE